MDESIGSQVKIVLLNAPPYAGKNTLGDADYSDLIPWPTCRVAVADPLKRKAYKFLMENGKDHILFEDLEKSKDKPMEILNGKTPREFYIAFSERLIKPFFGEDYFGQILKKDLERQVEYRSRTAKTPIIYLVSDAGFKPECQVLVDWVGAQNVINIEIYRRNSPGWDNDSRSRIHLDGVWETTVSNDGEPDEARRELAWQINRKLVHH